jgi:hypothetical protein
MLEKDRDEARAYLRMERAIYDAPLVWVWAGSLSDPPHPLDSPESRTICAESLRFPGRPESADLAYSERVNGTKPLHLRLRFVWFDAFASGSKQHEWRRYGDRYNERTCAIGRPVILGRGYTPERLTGTITSFDVKRAEGGAIGFYGSEALCAVIGIELVT